MTKTCVLFSLLFGISLYSISQNARINDLKYFLYEGYFSDDESFHAGIKPFLYDDISEADTILSKDFFQSIKRPLFNDPLSERETNFFLLLINPIIHSSVNYASVHNDLYFNGRIGASFEMSYKRRLFLSADYFFSRTTVFRQSDLQERYDIVPHFETAHFNGTEARYHSFSGEAAFKASEHLFFHTGKGKHFFGNGYRSLYLSDNSHASPYFKVTADIWKIKYIWLVLQTYDIQSIYGTYDYNLYKKAVFLHYFSLNLTKRINFNFFESVLTNPYDLNGDKAGYEWSYFNPVVFYRPIEFYNGTSDNSLMGLGVNIRFFRSLHLYSQFILDDLIISRINDGTGWWGNKYAVQAGIKAYDFLTIEGLFVRAELNYVRPYTYSHGQPDESNDISNLNYGSYVQPLAHPLGANFAEGMLQIKYRKGRFVAESQLTLAEKGADQSIFVSYGGNIYKSYNLRPDDTGITFLQGEQVKFIYTRTGVSYILNPALDLTANAFIQYRDISDFNDEFKLLFGIGISTKIFNERTDFF